MRLHDRPRRGQPRWLGTAWRRLAWRLAHVRRRATEAAARALLKLVLGVPQLRRLPRRALAALERALCTAADDCQFDRAFYLAHNPDVADAGIDPLTHYLRWGWAEGRSPNRWLDDALPAPGGARIRRPSERARPLPRDRRWRPA